jgi:nitrite reductase (NO-forming)
MKQTRHVLLLLLAVFLLAACGTQSTPEAGERGYTLTTGVKDGQLVFIGVGGDIDGVSNPVLHAEPGDTVTVTLINGEGAEHDLFFPEVNAKTKRLKSQGNSDTITFEVPNRETVLAYYDSVPGHAEAGMLGKLIVGTAAEEPVAVIEPASSAEKPADLYDKELALAAFQKGGCAACHAIPGIPGAVGTIGPDLSDISTMVKDHIDNGSYTGTAKDPEEYILESIQSPDAFISPKCPTGPCPMSVMPASLAQTLGKDEIKAIVDYLLSLPEGAMTSATEAGSAAEMPSMPAPSSADTNAVDITRDPAEIPSPIGNRGPENIRVDLETMEVSGKLADGTTYTYWTFGGQVPGPFIRVRVGDTVEVHLKNAMDSTMTHSVDFHAVTGPGGGAVATQTKPGEETMFTFTALNPGLYVYHCATPMVAQHISNGMYGLILVEPEGGLPPVDREFYVMQGEIYTTQPFGTVGALSGDTVKLLDEHPEYFVFNGAALALAGDAHQLHAKTGETIRIFFGVGGPNFTSSFHVIGEIFDRVYDQASLTASPLTDVQTTLVPPGGATMVEFKLEVPGRYILVDHALSRLQRGLAGYLIVEGDPNPEVFDGQAVPGSGH